MSSTVIKETVKFALTMRQSEDNDLRRRVSNAERSLKAAYIFLLLTVSAFGWSLYEIFGVQDEMLESLAMFTGASMLVNIVVVLVSHSTARRFKRWCKENQEAIAILEKQLNQMEKEGKLKTN